MIGVLPIKAQTSQKIIINADGSVTPATSAVQRIGDTYRLTANFAGSITVEANNIVLDGANHTLTGYGNTIMENCIGVNLTATNVTVTNIQLTNWTAVLLGAWNNNTIAHTVFTNIYQAVALYGDDNVVTQNSMSNCTVAVFVDGGLQAQGDNNIITENLIVGNDQAIDVMNSNGTTFRANQVVGNEYVLQLAQDTENTLLYDNDFVNNTQPLLVPAGQPFVSDMPTFYGAGQWDNGTAGNYWSDYTTLYPNASEIGDTGVGDTPYQIVFSVPYTDDYSNGTTITGTAVLGSAVDNHPLIDSAATETFTAGILPQETAQQAPEFPAAAVTMLLLAVGCFAGLVSAERPLKKHKVSLRLTFLVSSSFQTISQEQVQEDHQYQKDKLSSVNTIRFSPSFVEPLNWINQWKYGFATKW